MARSPAHLDGAQISSYPSADPTVSVNVEGTSGETHEVVYGNVGLGDITVCKLYDRNGNGQVDAGEPPVSGWRMELTGTDATGASVGPIVQVTDGTGCTTFTGLLPGSYAVAELVPDTGGWEATGATSTAVTIVSSLDGAAISGTSANVSFTNVCVSAADFDTKGYWHNKNGLAKITQADIAS